MSTKQSKRGAVFTCITAHYDQLYNHSYIDPNMDYICFTDNLSIAHKNNSHWQLRPLQFSSLDNVRNQRWHKLHPHQLLPDYEYSIWLDANIDVITPQIFLDALTLLDADKLIGIALHPSRDCLYDEAKECIKQQKDDESVIASQIATLRSEKFPEHFGLFETNIIFRKHKNKQVIQLMQDWWRVIESGSKRDQLSLTYVSWKHNTPIAPLRKSSYRNESNHIHFWPHNHEVREWGMKLASEWRVANSEKEVIVHERDVLRSENKTLVCERDMLTKEKIRLNKLINTMQSLLAENQLLQEELHIKKQRTNLLQHDLGVIKSAKFFKLWQIYARTSRLL